MTWWICAIIAYWAGWMGCLGGILWAREDPRITSTRKAFFLSAGWPFVFAVGIVKWAIEELLEVYRP